MNAKLLLSPLAIALAVAVTLPAQAAGVVGGATAGATQEASSNGVTNEGTQNKAQANDSIGNQTAGNIGANVAGGDNNQQSNAVALSSARATTLLSTGSAYAQVKNTQSSQSNAAVNKGTSNSAELNGSIGTVSGNVGANVAAGAGNQQSNDLAVADANFTFGGSAVASSVVGQASRGNSGLNVGTSNAASLDGSIKSISGNVGANVASGSGNQQHNDLSAVSVTAGGGAASSASSSTYQGSSGNTVTNSSTTTSTTGGGTTDAAVSLTGKAKDPILGLTLSNLTLSGTVAIPNPGTVSYSGAVQNNATLNGSILGVSGNIGANVASGSGNQQSNSLSISSSSRSSL